MKKIFTLARFFVCSASILLSSSIAYSQPPNPCEVYPAAGNDFENSLGAMTMYLLPPFGIYETIYLSGPTEIQRGDPVEDPGTGLTEIATEIVSMELNGKGYFVPFATVVLEPSSPSTGQITQITPGIDFPAESFFDVFVQVTVFVPTFGEMILHNEDPLHIEAVISCIPPNGTPYQHTEPVLLLAPTGEPIALLTHASHKLEGPIFSVMPNANLHNNALGPINFPNRLFPGASIAEPNLPGAGFPPIGRIWPPLLGLLVGEDNLDALSFGFDEVSPEPVNYIAITFSVDSLSGGAGPTTAVNFETTTGTTFGPPDLPDPPEQRADIFYTPIDGTNSLLYDEKDPTCLNFNMTVTNHIQTGSNCSPTPPGWPGGSESSRRLHPGPQAAAEGARYSG